MIEALLKAVGAKIDSSVPISYGTQYRVSRGADKAIVNVYTGKKGTSVVVQMNTPLAEELRAKAGGPTSTSRPPVPSPYKAWIGSDESGKGDYFGPMVTAAVAVTAAQAEQLAAWGVRDSKAMSDATAVVLERKIDFLCKVRRVEWMPETYNRRWAEASNVNRLLGEAHAEAIQALAAADGALEAAVTDQFGDPGYVERAVRGLGCGIALVQRPKADETDVAAGAASVVARAGFLRGLKALEEQWEMRFPKGAGPETVAAARTFVARYGREALGQVAKLHFRTTQGL